MIDSTDIAASSFVTLHYSFFIDACLTIRGKRQQDLLGMNMAPVLGISIRHIYVLNTVWFQKSSTDASRHFIFREMPWDAHFNGIIIWIPAVSVYRERNKMEGLSTDGAITKTLYGEWVPPSRTLSSDGCLSGCWGSKTVSYSTWNKHIALTCSSVMLKHVDPQLWVFGAHSKPEFGIKLLFICLEIFSLSTGFSIRDSERVSIVPRV